MSSESISAAAKRSGTPKATLFRWLKDADFQAELRQARQRTFSLSLSRVCYASNKAVDILINAMNGKKEITKMQFLSACKILEFGQAAIDSDFETRLSEIEKLLKEFAT